MFVLSSQITMIHTQNGLNTRVNVHSCIMSLVKMFYSVPHCGTAYHVDRNKVLITFSSTYIWLWQVSLWVGKWNKKIEPTTQSACKSNDKASLKIYITFTFEEIGWRSYLVHLAVYISYILTGHIVVGAHATNLWWGLNKWSPDKIIHQLCASNYIFHKAYLLRAWSEPHRQLACHCWRGRESWPLWVIPGRAEQWRQLRPHPQCCPPLCPRVPCWQSDQLPWWKPVWGQQTPVQELSLHKGKIVELGLCRMGILFLVFLFSF